MTKTYLPNRRTIPIVYSELFSDRWDKNKDKNKKTKINKNKLFRKLKKK